MFNRLREIIRKSPEIAVLISAVVGFLLSSLLNASQLIDFIVKSSRVPIVNMSVGTGILNSMTVKVPVNNIMKIPAKYAEAENPPMMLWKTLPIKAVFINPRHETMVYRNFRLIFLKEEKVSDSGACKNPDYPSPKNQPVGIYTYLVNGVSNSAKMINTPITIGSNEAKMFNIDFLVDGYIIGKQEPKKMLINFKKYSSFCLKWTDQNGKQYLSNIYHPLKVK